MEDSPSQTLVSSPKNTPSSSTIDHATKVKKKRKLDCLEVRYKNYQHSKIRLNNEVNLARKETGLLSNDSNNDFERVQGKCVTPEYGSTPKMSGVEKSSDSKHNCCPALGPFQCQRRAA